MIKNRVEFVYDGLADEKIREHGTFLATLRCACGSEKLTSSLFCEKCGRTSSVVLLHRRDVWLIYIGDTTSVPLDVLKCPHCNTLVSDASRLCERGETCLSGVVGVVVQRNRSGVFELHRCIYPARNRDAYVLPEGVAMMCELPPYLSLEAQVELLQCISEVHQEVHQEVEDFDWEAPQMLAKHILHTYFAFEENGEISRAELYNNYLAQSEKISPDTKPLSRQQFFSVVRKIVPNVGEKHQRVGGKLERFFTGIQHATSE